MKNSLIMVGLIFCVISCDTQKKISIHASVTIKTDTDPKLYNPMIFGGFLDVWIFTYFVCKNLIFEILAKN